jgi:adenylate cyclase
MSGSDPKRTLAAQDCCRANWPRNPISPVTNPCCNRSRSTARVEEMWALMAEARIQRRLAAILAADIAGYSRLMGSDEEGTIRAEH